MRDKHESLNSENSYSEALPEFLANFRLFSVTSRILKISTPDFIQTLHSDRSGPPATDGRKVAISDDWVLFEPPLEVTPYFGEFRFKFNK